MTTATLITKGWPNAAEGKLYGGCTVELTEEYDRAGKRLVRVLDGERAGFCIYVAEQEIAEHHEASAPEGIAS